MNGGRSGIDTSEMEQFIIGSLILGGIGRFEKYSALLPEDFINPSYQKFFAFLTEKYKKGEGWDDIVLKNAKNKPFVEFAVNAITLAVRNEIFFLENLHKDIGLTYLEELKKEKYRRDITEAVRTEKIPEKLVEKIIAIPKYQPIQITTFGEILSDTLAKAVSPTQTAYKFKFTDIQNYTGGLDAGELLVIGGYTSQGKSSLAIQMALDFAEQEYSILFCSAEMSETEIGRRILANRTGINSIVFRRGILTEMQRIVVEKKIPEIKQFPIRIMEVRNTDEIKAAVVKYHPDICFVDHLQNLAPKFISMSIYQKATENISDLQSLAHHRQTAMVVLSQLHRPTTDGRVPKPRLHSFRASGEIEEKANIAMLIWWEAKAENRVDRYQNSALPESFEVDIAKNRDGSTGIVELFFLPEYNRFLAVEKEKEREL